MNNPDCNTQIYNPIEKALKNPKSLRAAINAKCFDCQGEDSDPAPKWRIGNCEIPDCPLYPLRPYQSNLSRPMPAVLRGGGAQESTDGDLKAQSEVVTYEIVREEQVPSEKVTYEIVREELLS